MILLSEDKKRRTIPPLLAKYRDMSHTIVLYNKLCLRFAMVKLQKKIRKSDIKLYCYPKTKREKPSPLLAKA